MSEKGRMIIRKSKKGKWIFEVDIHTKQPMKIPDFYDLKDDSLNGKECEVERKQGGQIKKIIVDGKELPGKKQETQHSTSRTNIRPGGKQNQHQYSNTNNEWSISNTKLPSDTINALNGFNIDNFSLKLNKAAQFIIEDNKFEFFKTDKGHKVIMNVQPDYSKIDIKAIAEKHRKNIEKLNINIQSIILKPDWRLIVGLGNESVYETSMTLHHIYGIPYIPGSAIKGVTRNYIITEEFGNDENGSLDLKNAENRALHDKGFCDIFGCPKESSYKESRQGKIIFFDALPLSKPTIKPDIMNPHYGPYYSDSLGNIPPADYHNPSPIPFLTVKDTEFEFIIGINEKENTAIQNQKSKFEGKCPLEVGYGYMKKALSEHGIGAKTAVGYGYLLEKED